MGRKGAINMALNFGGNLFEGGGIFLGYRQSAANQIEILKYLNLPNDASYGTIYTVPAGKTVYVNSISYTNDEVAQASIWIATGGGGSEVVFLRLIIPANSTDLINLSIPIKLSSGTRIAAKTDNTLDEIFITLIGWEE